MNQMKDPAENRRERKKMMTIERFVKIEEKVKGVIGDALCRAINVNSSDFVLLMARGGYHEHLDRPDMDVTPFVLEDRLDFLMDLTRRKFFVRYLNGYVDGLKAGRQINDDEQEYELNVQMMIYAHIWESHLFLNQLARLAMIQQGKGYMWKTKLPQDGKKNFICRKIIDQFEKTDEGMADLIKRSYSDDFRNAFAHSTYFINGNRIQANKEALYVGPSVSIEGWEDMFVRSVLLSYNLNDMLLEMKNSYVEDAGDGPIAIDMPMKHNHKEKRSVLIKPERIEGKEEKVRFRYMSKEEVEI